YVSVPRFQGMAVSSDDVRVDQGAACDCGHLLDGRYALSAAAVRLSLRGGARLKAVRDVQGHGAAAPGSDHQSRDDRHLACRALPRVERPLVHLALVSREVLACARDVGPAWRFLAHGEGFCG